MPRLGTGQQEVGDVRAADEEHEAHRAEQHEENAPHVAECLVADRDQDDAEVGAVRVGVLGAKALNEGVHVSLRGVE
jgi:hypothetical protein